MFVPLDRNSQSRQQRTTDATTKRGRFKNMQAIIEEFVATGHEKGLLAGAGSDDIATQVFKTTEQLEIGSETCSPQSELGTCSSESEEFDDYFSSSPTNDTESLDNFPCQQWPVFRTGILFRQFLHDVLCVTLERLRVLLPGAAGMHQDTGPENDNTPDKDRNNSLSSAGSQSNAHGKRKHTAKSTGIAQKSGQNDDRAGDEDDDDEEEKSRKRPKQTPASRVAQISHLRLACPFYKHNPEKYQTSRACIGPGWDNTHRLKLVLIF